MKITTWTYNTSIASDTTPYQMHFCKFSIAIFLSATTILYPSLPYTLQFSMAACSYFKSWGPVSLPQHALSELQENLQKNQCRHICTYGQSACAGKVGGNSSSRRKPTQTGGEPASEREGAGPRFNLAVRLTVRTAEQAHHPRLKHLQPVCVSSVNTGRWYRCTPRHAYV